MSFANIPAPRNLFNVSFILAKRPIVKPLHLINDGNYLPYYIGSPDAFQLQFEKDDTGTGVSRPDRAENRAIHRRARARVAQTTSAAPEERRMRAHSEMVEPVVMMSSMRRTRRPATSSGSTAR